MLGHESLSFRNVHAQLNDKKNVAAIMFAPSQKLFQRQGSISSVFCGLAQADQPFSVV